MFRQILVPLDGSQLAEWAIPIAEQLAVLTAQLAMFNRCTVHLVRVIDLISAASWAPTFGAISDGTVRSEHDQAHDYLQNMRARLEADGVQVTTQELTGETVGTLLRYEQEAAIDLVVMCSHLRSGVSRLAMGSVAEQLLREGSAPVLLVHAGTPAADLRHAVVPLDGSPFAELALPVIERLLPYVVRRVTLVHVLKDLEDARLAERYLGHCAMRLHELRAACDYRVVHGDPGEAILEVTRPDRLLIMTTHCRTLLSRIARNSVAAQVLHAGAPVVLLVRH